MTKLKHNITANTFSLGLSGALIGVVVAVIFSIWFVFYFGFIEHLHDSLVILVSISLVCVVLGFLIGLTLSFVLSVFARLTKHSESLTYTTKWWYRISLTLLFQTVLWILWIQLQRPFEMNGTITFFEFIVSLTVSISLAELVRRLVTKRSVSAFKTLFAIAGLVGAGWLMIVAANLFSGSSNRTAIFSLPEIVDSNYKVALLGIDGATWDVIDKLIAEGRLPNLKHLVSQGVRAPLRAEISILNPFANSSSQGMRSCSAWTTIGTGRTYQQHGLHDFLRTYVPGLKNPVPFRIPFTTKIGSAEGKLALRTLRPTSRDKRTLAVWDIVSMAGFRAGVLGWWVSWPPSAIDGYIITDRILEKSPFRWYPIDLFEEDLAEFKLENLAQIATRFADIKYTPEKDVRVSLDNEEQMMMQRFDVLLKDLQRDSLIYHSALELLKQEQPELFAVYFLSPDNAEHLFWKYMDPEPFADVRESDIERFGHVIPRSYDMLDRWIGELSSCMTENTVIIICSDHGMGPWLKKGGLISGNKLWPLNSGNHRRHGILIISGGPIKQAVPLQEARQIDIVPTILAILGLPVPRDMNGRVLTEAFTESFTSMVFTSIDSYERFRPAPFITDATEKDIMEIDQEYLERLKALGYIGGEKGK